MLLTGFPGFIGRRLAQRLVEDGASVIALVEPRMGDAAREAAIEGLEVLEGDITERHLGLGDADWERLTSELTSVFHLAAVYDLAVPFEIAVKVNVDGTGNVLDLCLECEKLERFNYVSTAYVAGDRTGVVYEHELVLGQGFKNHYESTKFQAEVWVRGVLDRVPTTIYRPAIVVGDSQTGETQKFDGPYYMLRVIALGERRHLPIPQFGRAEAPFNVVPVDFVVDALMAASTQPEAAGQTLHLVDPEPVTAAELLRDPQRRVRGPAALLPSAGAARGEHAAVGGRSPDVRRRAARVDHLSQPPGALRYPADAPHTRPRGPSGPALRGVRRRDGPLLPRARGGSVVRAGLVSGHLDSAWHRALLDDLCSFPRGTATEGEHRAAQWVADRLGEEGAPARLEEEPSNGGYWWPLGVAGAAGLVAGLAARRGRRGLATALGALAAAAAVDDLPPGGRRLRRLLPRRSGWNVVAEAGPEDADYTVVVGAHHDAANSGWIFTPAIPETIDRVAPWALERSDTSPPLMAPVVGAPAVVAAGALSGRRGLLQAGLVLCAGVVACMAQIGTREVVPGANDNGTGVVALLALARALAERPTQRTRVVFLSTSEEATCEGMHHFATRHFPELPRERTFFLSLDTLGSPHLLVLRGEGMLRMREYPAEALALIDGLAEELGIELFPNLRLRNATDGIYPLAAGYPCATVCSCTRLKQPSNYHWPTDVPENVELGTLADGIRLAEATVRRLDERWLAN